MCLLWLPHNELDLVASTHFSSPLQHMGEPWFQVWSDYKQNSWTCSKSRKLSAMRACAFIFGFHSASWSLMLAPISETHWDTVCSCYNGPRYNGNLIQDALTSQSHLAVADKLKFWPSRYNGNLVLHVRYSKGRLYIDELSGCNDSVVTELYVVRAWSWVLCHLIGSYNLDSLLPL